MIGKLIILLCLSVMFGHAHADVKGRVIRVVDGDTIILQEMNGKIIKVRLLGIDAPELDQPFGYESSALLTSFVENKMVYVASNKKDRYQRLLGKVLMKEKDINYQLIKNGYAWHFKRYSSNQKKNDVLLYADAEKEAQQFRRGLWKALSPKPPWEWRKKSVKN
ncbi:nuclease (SNase-like) protein [Methylophilales bacterium HTCC2181]|uniref:Nuclease (SNase-like) protein n=1 Tax=Methylophilales bacterium HTCC2181 TaxID=383631 RepID=A0P6T9_9PROT|nr:nuclease (SNase-like) protein [Methylophilales bacterium HTCC2181]